MGRVILLLGWALLGSPVPQNNRGVIEGTVTRFGTTEGIASVRITITRDGQEELEYEPEAVTDATGRFLIRNASPGPYTIRAARSGYSTPFKDGVEVTEGGASKQIVVVLERSLVVNLALSPAAVIAGRVLNPLGQPAEGAVIEAIPVGGDSKRQNPRTAQADDRGQYRIWGLTPGKYKLALEYRRDFAANLPLFAQPSWVKTYFPGTIDSERSALIEVGEGAIIEGVNFGFQQGQAYKISGVVVDPDRAKRSGIPDFYLIPAGGNSGKLPETPRMSQNSLGPAARQPGAFEIQGVPAGRYILYAEDWSMGANLHDNFVVSQALLDVTSDVNDINLVMSGTSVVEGTVRTADQQPARNVRVVLIPPEELRGHPMFYKEAKSDASGKFTIKGVMPGDYTAYAIEASDFKDSPPPNLIYGLPAFLEPYAGQGVSVKAAPDGRVNASVPLLRKNN